VRDHYLHEVDTHLLLVEDDDAIAEPLERALGREFVVTRVATGRDALDEVRTGRHGLVVLDLGLPDVDGLEVCRVLREEGHQLPVLMLTARSDELDRVVGLDVGADDYLTKPFGLAELSARLRALLRRTGGPAGAPGADPPPPAPLEVDEGGRRVHSGGREIALTPKEFDLLALLVREAGQVLSRERLMDEVWDENWFGSTKTLDVTVARVRQKLESHEVPARITTVRGVGFRYEPRATDA
jgi:DNA-binding response OmpR family regulator